MDTFLVSMVELLEASLYSQYEEPCSFRVCFGLQGVVLNGALLHQMLDFSMCPWYLDGKLSMITGVHCAEEKKNV